MNPVITHGINLKKACVLFLFFAFAFLSVIPDAISQVDTFQFDTEEQQQRFRNLSNELRCPMCQNTNLSGSTGGVAEDLRREIHRMIIEGMTDVEIEQFMFERYGDFIFYRPRLRAETVLLWFAQSCNCRAFSFWTSFLYLFFGSLPSLSSSSSVQLETSL